jgi:glycosyltransferase involved in cell wall biosynthesis
LKLLIGGSPSKLFHLREFARSLESLGVECKVVLDVDYCDGFPSRKITSWVTSNSRFNDLVKTFKPDSILVDRQRHFGLAASKTSIPLLVHLRGDYWKEIQMAEETLYKSPPKRLALWQWEKIAEKCFEHADIILPICKHLESRVKEYYPTKKTATMYQGITPDNWYHVEGTKLRHPCIGLLQSAVIWEKTKEMLTLEPILKKFPKVMFYWVGDGPYRDYVLSKLEKYDNFKWLGSLQYPDKVREYLSEIDVYLLLSGIDMSPLTLLEAQLMEKPVIATSVGGIPELMDDNKTGFLINRGDHLALIDKIDMLLSNENKRELIGKTGRDFVKDHFSWEKIAKDFVITLKEQSLI